MRAMIAKDLKLIGKEKTILSAMGILVFLASFSSIVTFGLLILYKPDVILISNVKIGVAGRCEILKSVSGVEKYSSLDKAMRDFYSGKVDAVIYLPNESLAKPNFVTVFLPKDEIAGIVAGSKVKEILIEYEKKMRAVRGIPPDDGFKIVDYNFNSVVERGSSVTFRFIYSVLIPLLAITTGIIAGGLVVDQITEEFESRTIEVVLSTPMSFREFIAGKIVVSLLVSTLLSITWIALLALNVEIANIPLLFLTTISFSLILTSAGAVIASYLCDRERSQLIFSFLAISTVTLSFTYPWMVAGVIARVSAGGYLTASEVLIYPLSSLLSFLISITLSERAPLSRLSLPNHNSL